MTDDETRRAQTTVRELAREMGDYAAKWLDDVGVGHFGITANPESDSVSMCAREDFAAKFRALAALSLLDAREAQPPTGWQPIATAPEATTVFVWLPNYGAFPAHMTRDANGNPDWWNRGENAPCYPTHWRPMFKPPADAQAQPPTGTPAEWTPGKERALARAQRQRDNLRNAVMRAVAGYEAQGNVVSTGHAIAVLLAELVHFHTPEPTADAQAQPKARTPEPTERSDGH